LPRPESRRSVSFWSESGPSSQKRDLAGTEESREVLVESDEAIALGTIGLVPDDTVGKVTAAREHRDSRLGGGAFDFDRTDGDKAVEDIDDLRARVSIRTFQHPYQFAQYDRRHDDRIRRFDRVGSFDGLRLVVPCQITDEDVRIDGDPQRSPISIASRISSSETGR
jgi:hypothetical protein